MALNLYTWKQQTTSVARNIVLQIIRSSATPLSTKDIFHQAVKVHADRSQATWTGTRTPTATDAPAPPNPDHPIRSVNYLKNVVIPDLVKRRQIEQVHAQRSLSQREIEQRLASMTKAQRAQAGDISQTINVFLWKPKVSGPRPVQKVKPQEPFLEEAGVNEDWSHLNRRRQRAREASVNRDLKWMKKVHRAKQEGIAQAEASTS
ncbi:hypothetical protein DENSPDRAFT_843558 [Dentipellis sp. KUC8613]|nr:hypothetical protein DENSPDRAFT_843558 [Dentipellis sp. KUC8613]